MSVEALAPVDYRLVQTLRARTAERLRAERRRLTDTGAATLSADDERELGRSLIAAAVDDHRRSELLGGAAELPPAEADTMLARAVEAALFGLGRLEPLLSDPAIVNIEINGCDRVWLYGTDGSVTAGPPVADSDAELVEWVRTAAVYAGLSSRPFDPANPWLELRLPDGSRLCALMSVVARPVVSIRCYRLTRVTLNDLREWGAFDDELLAFLTAAVAGRANLIVSGETFAGKTTLLRGLGNAVGFDERIVTAEHFLELGFEHFPDLHRDVVAMEERLPNAEGVGALTLLDLVERSRRMNPDRLIVGEVRGGGEIVAMLDAMTQGEDGSLSTIHARDSRTVFHRIASYALTGRHRLPVEASGMLTGSALDFVVHLSKRREPQGRVHRFVSSVREVLGFDGTQVVSAEVFATQPGDTTARAAAPLSPARAEQLAAAGYRAQHWAGEA
jgi:Flp pilus assembly CpaF family ATPase